VTPTLTAKALPGGRTQVVYVHQMKWIGRHPAECDKDIAPQSISDTKDWLVWNGDLDNPNDSKDDWDADYESDLELDNGINDSESPEQQNESAAPIVPRLIWPTRR